MPAKTLFAPTYRAQGNEFFRVDIADRTTKRGQNVPYDNNGAPSGGTVAWGSITGPLSAQADLQTALNGKQPVGAYLTANQTITLSGDATGSGATAITVTIAANAVSFAKFVAATAAGFVGATAAGNFSQLTPSAAKGVLAITASDVSGLGYFATGTDAANLTGTVPAGVLPLFSSTAAGAVPASGGGTANFMRADGTWAAPSGTTSFILDLDGGLASDTFTSGIDVDGGTA